MKSAEYNYARDLAYHLWYTHYKDDAPDWEPLDNLYGVLMQIDNMITGLIRNKEGKGMKLRDMVQNCAFVFGSGVGAMVEALGMMSANLEAHKRGEAIPYPEQHFTDLIAERGLDFYTLRKQIYGG